VIPRRAGAAETILPSKVASNSRPILIINRFGIAWVRLVRADVVLQVIAAIEKYTSTMKTQQ
jgi:hypothetical protein